MRSLQYRHQLRAYYLWPRGRPYDPLLFSNMNSLQLSILPRWWVLYLKSSGCMPWSLQKLTSRFVIILMGKWSAILGVPILTIRNPLFQWTYFEPSTTSNRTHTIVQLQQYQYNPLDSSVSSQRIIIHMLHVYIMSLSVSQNCSDSPYYTPM